MNPKRGSALPRFGPSNYTWSIDAPCQGINRTYIILKRQFAPADECGVIRGEISSVLLPIIALFGQKEQCSGPLRYD